MVIKNLNITGKTRAGDTIFNIEFIGGMIKPNQQTILTTNETLAFKKDLSSTIYCSLQGRFGVNLAGFFEKTIPFHINITASFQELFKNISIPTLSIKADVTDITQDGVLFGAIVSINNPNFFEMSLKDFLLQVEIENGTIVGEFSPIQGKITPNSTSDFQLSGTLLYTALNGKILTLRVSGYAGVHVMGIDKSIAVTTEAYLIMPEIRQLLFHNDSLGITLSLNPKLRLRGIRTTIGLRLSNPSKIPLQAHDLLCTVYGLTGENKKIIIQRLLEPVNLDAETQDYLETQILISYMKLFTSGTKKIFPDWFVIQIEGNFSIARVTQSIPVSIDATINPHLLRP